MAFTETDLGLLRSVPLFRGLAERPGFEEAFTRIVRDPAHQIVVPAGHAFLHEGTQRPGLHLVVHGIIELFVASSAEGKIVDFAKAGAMIGEETLFDNRPLLYSARAVTPAVVLHVPEAHLDRWLAEVPPLALRLAGLMAERVHYLYKDIVTYCTKNATARLVCYLVCQFDRAPRTPDGSFSLNIPIPRNKIASRLGVSDSHLSRAFRELELQGLITKTRNGIFIPDVPALSRYVCPAGCDW